jgi:hypothetical protein
VISILPQPERSLQKILDIAYQDSAVAAALADFRQQGHQGFLVHVMPQHYGMQGLFVQPAMSGMQSGFGSALRRVVGFIFPFLNQHRRHEMMGMMADDEPVRLIFSQLTWPDGEYAPFDRALAFNVKHLPLLKVDIDNVVWKAITVEHTSPRNYWGQMPMPAF